MSRGQRSDIGSTRFSPNGYHYTRTTEGWELTHRLTAEKMLGRKLNSNERVSFKEGFDKAKDYANPDALLIATSRQRSTARRRAQIQARIDELQAELDELDALEAKSGAK